jgi:soluble lytic murein transglycosylase-like protein
MIDKISHFLTYVLLIITFLPFTMNPDIEVKEDRDFLKLAGQYKWLDVNIYNIINEKAKKYKIDKELVCAVIQYESGDYCRNNLKKMRVVVSRSGAIGPMQIMSFHTKNPKLLYNLKFNIEKGTWYLSVCLKKSKGNIREACRMYNAGVNSKRWKYKNWAYVNRIEKSYLLASCTI